MNTTSPLTLTKEALKLSLPMAGSRFLQMLTGFIGMLMVAHIGETVLAASALINSMLATTIVVMIALLFSTSVMAGQNFGAKNFSNIGKVVQQSCVLATLLTPVMMLLFWYTPDLLALTHQKPQLIVYVRQYFHASLWMTWPLLVTTSLQQFCYGVLKQRLVIILSFIGIIIFTPFAYAFIFGKWGLPDCGVAGLAYAFAVMDWVLLGMLIASLYYIKDFKKYNLFKKHDHGGFTELKKLFQIGWPMSAQFGGELVSLTVSTIFIGWLGENALAATQIAQQWLILIVVPAFAIAEASGILVSQAVGAKQFDLARRSGNICLFIGLGLILLIDVALVFFPHFLIGFYLDIHKPSNLAIVNLARILLGITALNLAIDVCRNITAGSLRGFYDTQYAMWVGLAIMWFISVPVGYAFGFWLHWGVVGIRLGSTVAFSIGAVFLLIRWRRKFK